MNREIKLTEFEFYKNTPFNDLINTILFNSNEERDNFFREKYDTVKVKAPFNFVRDRSTIKVMGSFNDFKDVNYCSFKSDFDDIRYYAFIPQFQYVNDGVILLHLMIDGIMTFCQGDTLNNLKNLTISRQHLTTKDYYDNLVYLKNNNDVIDCHTKQYFYEKTVEFKEFNVLIHSTVDLSKPFGDVDNPKIESSTGGNIDTITSPVDLYLLDEKDFNSVMEKLAPFPWITQNFKRIFLVPKQIIDKDMEYIKTETVKNTQVDLSKVKKVISGGTTPYSDFLDKLKLSNDQLLKLFGLDKNTEHLLRNHYTTIEVYDWTGQVIMVDAGQLHYEYGLEFKTLNVGGYNNELVVYLDKYKSSNINTNSFKNDSIVFNDFDDIPILIDSYDLSLSKSANQRKYNESNLFTKKIGRIVDTDNDLQDRLMTSVSVLSNLSPLSVGRGLVDEHEHYRRKQAENLDLALQSPIISEQSTNNALNKKYEKYGITVKLSKPSRNELNNIKRYYNLFGYGLDFSNTKLSDIRSMSMCNYLQCEGNFSIKGCERSLLDVIKIRLENGVRFWHNVGIENPFTQNVLYNERRE